MITVGTPLVINSDGNVRKAIGDEEPFRYALATQESDETIQIQLKDSPTQIVLPTSAHIRKTENNL